ncbi:MAG: hypothetical protein OQK82_05975 [Candidatus Pacearchaeota archaeon]|nr:hypothetical protein [Candidatus Pacearchaeota archaeon]
MKKSIQKGFGFGITSGIITTLGLIIGLYSGTHSKVVVLSGILTIAIADAMSDALGIHISEESVSKDYKQVWESTVSTFLFKFIFASMFILPFLFLELQSAIIFCIAFGMILLGVFSYYIAKSHKEKPIPVISEHVIIGIIVVVLTYFVGELVGKFG